MTTPTIIKSQPRVLVITNMPVHHQIDLFDAIHSLGEIDLDVCYLRKMSAGRLWQMPEEFNHSCFFLPEVRIRDHWYVNRGILKLLKQMRNYDLVIVGQYASITMQIAMYYASFRKIPWIFWSESISGVRYSDSPLLNSDKLRSLFRFLAIVPIKLWPEQCWGIGSKAVDSFWEALPHGRFQKFAYYSDLTPFIEIHLEGQERASFAFLYSGSLSYRKGFDLIIGAVDKLVQNGKQDFRVHVVGSGKLESEIPSRLLDNFHLYGFVQRKSLPEYYKGKDILLFPSRYDGWGMSLVEAMAAGIPVIVGLEAGAAQEIVQDGVNGWLLEEMSSSELARRMEWCLTHREELPAISLQAHYSALNYHTDVGATRFSTIVNSVLSHLK